MRWRVPRPTPAIMSLKTRELERTQQLSYAVLAPMLLAARSHCEAVRASIATCDAHNRIEATLLAALAGHVERIPRGRGLRDRLRLLDNAHRIQWLTLSGENPKHRKPMKNETCHVGHRTWP